MKNKLFFLLWICTSILILTSSVKDTQSNAAPLGSTGAPGENSCNKSGCHIGPNLNAGDAILNIDYNHPNSIYTPNEIYSISISLHQSNIQRFGFQFLALNAKQENVGTIIITDSARTQSQIGIGPYQGRNYATYKYPGTEPFASGLGQWTIQWKAPNTYQGPITFYVSAVAANNDATDAGDTVYTKQMIIQENTSDIEMVNIHALELEPFQNPAQDLLKLNYTISESSSTIIQLIDILTQKIYKNINIQDDAGKHSISLDISQVPHGLYLLAFSSNNRTEIKKLIIEP